MPKIREESKEAFPEVLAEVEKLREWMLEHSPQEFAAHVTRMTPEERVRVRAQMSVLREWLGELGNDLSGAGRG